MEKVKSFSLFIALITICNFLAACAPRGRSAGTNTTGASSPISTIPINTTPYYGFVDYWDCQELRGWVWNSSAPEASVKVALHIDDKLIEVLPAQTPRPDLVDKVGTGRYGFSFKVPSAYRDSKSHTVKVKVVDSEYIIPFYEGVRTTSVCEP